MCSLLPALDTTYNDLKHARTIYQKAKAWDGSKDRHGHPAPNISGADNPILSYTLQQEHREATTHPSIGSLKLEHANRQASPASSVAEEAALILKGIGTAASFLTLLPLPIRISPFR